jgi:broad specificity phosphatase PhoE
MRPETIYLIRHGESIANLDRDVHNTMPDWKVPLTKKGAAQAVIAGSNLHGELKGYIDHHLSYDRVAELTLRRCRPLIRFYTSPYIRTKQTCDQISLYFPNCEIREDPRIREQDWGNYMSQEINEKIDRERESYGTFFYRMPNGESGADVFDRVSTFLDTLYRDFENPLFPRFCCFVSHGLAIRLILMRWLHWTVDKFETLANPDNCQMIKLRLNETNHYELISDLKLKNTTH